MTAVDFTELRRLVAERYISAQRHPEAPLTIYNYTARAQYEGVWTPETLAARGLIINDDERVVARPFPKFFNLAEHRGSLPDEPADVFDKVDGSLGILYWVNGLPAIATRGSFTSTQARWATRWLRAHLCQWSLPLDAATTSLFEIIYPENRIVVDYGSYAGLVLLGMIDTETGDEHRWWDSPAEAEGWGVRLAQHYGALTEPPGDMVLGEHHGREGFVIRYQSGLRLKVKFEEYVRLHRLLTGFSERHVWECLSAGQDLDSVLAAVPDEFYSWAQTVAGELHTRYDQVLARCHGQYQVLGDRKATALYFQTCDHPQVLYAMLDNKPYAPMIWKLLKPEAGAVFRHDEDAPG